jgi:hypothetical protein
LKRAEPKEVEQIGVEPRNSVSYALIQERIETRAPTQHAVDELARPTPIAGVEVVFVTDASVKGRVEQLARAEVGTDGGGSGTSIGDSARRYDSRRRAAARGVRAAVVRSA